MNALELFAVIFAVLILVKLIVVLINPQVWMDKVVTPIYGNPTLFMIIFVILAVVVGYYLLPFVSVVEVGAVGLFIALLAGIGILPYSKSLLPKMKEEVIRMGVSRAWLSITIWLVISLWILYSVFS